jgi:hypothetical protein
MKETDISGLLVEQYNIGKEDATVRIVGIIEKMREESHSRANGTDQWMLLNSVFKALLAEVKGDGE